MLAADKDAMVAETRQGATQIRNTELEFLLSRYFSIGGLGVIAMGFAFDGITELDIQEDDSGFQKNVGQGFYLSAILTFGFALYIVIIASFTCVWGERLALQGIGGVSLDRAVNVLTANYFPLMWVGAATGCTMLAAILCLVWCGA